MNLTPDQIKKAFEALAAHGAVFPQQATLAKDGRITNLIFHADGSYIIVSETGQSQATEEAETGQSQGA